MPFLAPLIPLVAGAVASAASGGGDDAPAPDATAQTAKDNDFEWGGAKGGAAGATNRYIGLGGDAAKHAAPTADWGQSNQSRGSEEDALGQMQQAAQGNAPSAAANMMAQGNDEAIANQMSMAAGARGAGAMAGAQQQAMGNAANMSAHSQQNAGILRAQEMAQARGAYGQMASGIRGQDESRQQYLGNLQEQQNALNQQGQMGYEQMGYNVQNAQLGATMGRQGFNQDAWKAQMGADASSRDASANNVKTGVQAGVDVIKGVAGSQGSDEGMKDGIQDIGAGSDSAPGGFGANTAASDGVRNGGYDPDKVDGMTGDRTMGDRFRSGAAAMDKRLDQGSASQPIDFGTRHREVQLPAAMPAAQMGAPVQMSDAHAKQNAYEMGLAAAGRQMQGSQAHATAPRSVLDDAFAAMPAKSFAYKPGVPGTQPGVTQAGIIAQDAERHPLTAAMVRETPHGKAIDLGTATSLNLAANSEHAQRLQKLEAQAAELQGSKEAQLGSPEPQMGGRRRVSRNEEQRLSSLGNDMGRSLDAQMGGRR